jgi:hypothetical protein
VIIKQLLILGCAMRSLDSAGRTQTHRSCTESSPQQARIPQHLPSKSDLVQERVSPITREEHDTLKVYGWLEECMIKSCFRKFGDLVST